MVRRLTYRDGRQKFTYAKLKAPGSCEGQMTKGMKEQAVEVVTTLRGKDTHSLSDTACHFCWKLREGSTQRWLLYLASCAESLAIFMIFYKYISVTAGQMARDVTPSASPLCLARVQL